MRAKHMDPDSLRSINMTLKRFKVKTYEAEEEAEDDGDDGEYHIGAPDGNAELGRHSVMQILIKQNLNIFFLMLMLHFTLNKKSNLNR